MKPFWAGDNLNASLIKGAIAPFKTHIAKQKSKYRNDAKRVPGCPDFKKALNPATFASLKI
jgi:hypothetical protein